MAHKPNKTVCGVPVSLSDPIFSKPDGSPTVDPAQAVKGLRRASLSKPGARRLVDALKLPLPRIGTSIKLCADQHLINMSGSFYVVRQADGDFQGARRRRSRGRR